MHPSDQLGNSKKTETMFYQCCTPVSKLSMLLGWSVEVERVSRCM